MRLEGSGEWVPSALRSMNNPTVGLMKGRALPSRNGSPGQGGWTPPPPWQGVSRLSPERAGHASSGGTVWAQVSAGPLCHAFWDRESRRRGRQVGMKGWSPDPAGWALEALPLWTLGNICMHFCYHNLKGRSWHLVGGGQGCSWHLLWGKHLWGKVPWRIVPFMRFLQLPHQRTTHGA